MPGWLAVNDDVSAVVTPETLDIEIVVEPAVSLGESGLDDGAEDGRLRLSLGTLVEDRELELVEERDASVFEDDALAESPTLVEVDIGLGAVVMTELFVDRLEIDELPVTGPAVADPLVEKVLDDKLDSGLIPGEYEAAKTASGSVSFVKVPELELCADELERETPVLRRRKVLDAPDWYGLNVLCLEIGLTGETPEPLKAMLVLNP